MRSVTNVGAEMTSLRLLFVCTGNICRSPSAEYLLRARLEHLLGDDAKKFQLSSAGLGTPGGWEIDPTAWVIRGMRRVKLAWNVVEITPERQAQKLTIPH